MEAWLYGPDYVKRGLLPVLGGQVVLRRNAVSTWVLDIDGNHPNWGRWEPGCRVVIRDGDWTVLSGAANRVPEESTAGVRDVTLAGRDDVVWLDQMITLPNPSRQPDAQDDAAYWKATGPAETVIRDLIRLNRGPDALAPWRTPMLLEPDQGRGGQVSVNSRFKNLLEECQGAALTGGVHFWLEQDDAARASRLRFSTPRDLTRAVRLTPESGAVSSYSLMNEAPTTTDVLVAGQGEGEARTLRLVSGNENSWGVRALTFQDRRDTDETSELVQAGEETLAEARERASVAFEVGDTPRLQLGRDFTVGDRITVELEDGARISDIVQMADITWSETGRTVKLQVGPVLDEEDTPRWVTEYRRLRAAIHPARAI